MRLFIALNFPPELQGAVYDAAAPLRTAAPTARWVRRDRLHLTLEFLGERQGDVVAPLRVALDAVAERHPVMTLDLHGFGAFPNLRHPRVVWAGIATSPDLTRLQRDVSDACAVLGFPRDARPFRPHVTVARIGARTGRLEVEALARSVPGAVLHATATVRTLDLMESVAGRYETLHAAPLLG